MTFNRMFQNPAWSLGKVISIKVNRSPRAKAEGSFKT